MDSKDLEDLEEYEERKCFRYIMDSSLVNSVRLPGQLDKRAGTRGILGYVIQKKTTPEQSSATIASSPQDDNNYEQPSTSTKKQCLETVEEYDDVEPIEENLHYSEIEDSDIDSDDICGVCSSRHGFNTLIECSYCLRYIHIECYNLKQGASLKGVPRGLFACHGEQCKEWYIKQVQQKKIKNYLNLKGLIVPEEDIKGGPLNEESELGNESDGSDDESLIDEEFHYIDSPSGIKVRVQSHVEQAALNLLEIRRKNPLKFIAAKEYCRNQKSLHPDTYLDIVECVGHELELSSSLAASERQLFLERLKKKKPPQNIRRALEVCSDGGIQAQRLVWNFPKEGVEAFWVMNRFRVIEVALDLYRSVLNRSRGPFHHVSKDRCSTGRVPDNFSKLEEFAATMNFDCHDPSNLTLFVSLYSDDSRSASGNVEFCPCWISLTSMDPSVRFLEREDAHGLVCFLPDQKSIQYQFDAKHVGSDGLAQSSLTWTQKYHAYVKLRAQAMQWLFEDIKRDEKDGLPYVLDGKEVRVRILVNWYIADMKERRVLLGMLKGPYHCFRCYAFPGKPNPDETSRGPRTQIEDKKIRVEMKNGRSLAKKAPTTALERKLDGEARHLGIPLKDECPITSSEKSAIFTCRGPYELFGFDALHNKDGLITYFPQFLEMRLGGNFIAQSERFGNVYLLTNRLSMHVMELGLESFHSIPLTIMFGEFSKEISKIERDELYLCACDLLRIVSLLTDPCPGFILEELKATIQSFSSRLDVLLDAINKSSDKKQHMTPKMHELIEHVIEQIQVMGLPDAYSTKIYETMHQSLKNLMQASSMHSDGHAFREVLLTTFFRRMLNEANSRLDVSSYSDIQFGSPWRSDIKFHIAQPLDKRRMSFGELLSSNLDKMFSTVFRTVYPESFGKTMRGFGSASLYGSSLYMQIFCALRNKEETEKVVAVVPGTSKGRIFNGGTFNALAFKDPAMLDEELEKQFDFRSCPVPNCASRHHKDDFEYACSASRDENTAYGLPILFFDSTAIVLPLYPVPRSESTVPMHSAILDVRCEPPFQIVPFKSIRGICVYRPNDSKLNEFRGFLFTGRNVFGHRSECEH